MIDLKNALGGCKTLTITAELRADGVVKVLVVNDVMKENNIPPLLISTTLDKMDADVQTSLNTYSEITEEVNNLDAIKKAVADKKKGDDEKAATTATVAKRASVATKVAKPKPAEAKPGDEATAEQTEETEEAVESETAETEVPEPAKAKAKPVKEEKAPELDKVKKKALDAIGDMLKGKEGNEMIIKYMLKQAKNKFPGDELADAYIDTLFGPYLASIQASTVTSAPLPTNTVEAKSSNDLF